MWEEGPHGQWVQTWPSAEEWGRPVIGHRRLQLDAGEGIPEKRRVVLVVFGRGAECRPAATDGTHLDPDGAALSSGPVGGRGRWGEPGRGAVRKAS